jgi:multidrug efflux pump subunit AcrA (membrane-fusion protein)
MFARLWLGTAELSGARGPKTIEVPREAIVRRAELTAVYVLDPGGKPVLRQVRLGRASEGKVEVLSGLSGGERVATDPQAAARVR